LKTISLKLENIHVYYGNLHALKNVSLEVGQGEIVTLIGANGSGKSTILRVISGLIRAAEGTIRCFGEEITHLPTEDIVARGVVHVPEGRRIFPGLTVLANLEVATAPWRRRRENIEKELQRVFTIFPVLRERAGQLGWSLSGGEQQMLAIGRSLMSRPKILLLDEPSLGLAPKLVFCLFETIQSINRKGTTVLLVEQNAYGALQIAHRGYVLAGGSIVLSGLSQELIRNQKVKEAYLGGCTS